MTVSGSVNQTAEDWDTGPVTLVERRVSSACKMLRLGLSMKGRGQSRQVSQCRVVRFSTSSDVIPAWWNCFCGEYTGPDGQEHLTDRCISSLTDFSALCSRLGFMRIPGEIPMKVLMTKGFLAPRSHASKPCLSLRELAGTRCTSMPVMPGGTGRRNRYQTFFSFTYFHGPSAARPLGWPLRMTNGKVS
jgi:hypothetical protein